MVPHAFLGVGRSKHLYGLTRICNYMNSNSDSDDKSHNIYKDNMNRNNDNDNNNNGISKE